MLLSRLEADLVPAVVVWLARRHGAWDARHDALFWAAGLGIAAFALWLNQDAITGLSALNLP